MQGRTIKLATLLVLAAACGGRSAGGTTPTAASPSSARELPPREKLPLPAREMLTMRMDRHGERMILLLESVILLNYDLTAILANEIVAEPKIGRPAGDETNTLNALLPAAFFDHQDQLALRAAEVASAATAKKDAQLMAAFARLTESCVGCHAAYLYEDDERMKDGETELVPDYGSDAEHEPGETSDSVR